jgi:hypothetical protein
MYESLVAKRFPKAYAKLPLKNNVFLKHIHYTGVMHVLILRPGICAM